MNTQRVQELLKEIETVQSQIHQLTTQRESIQQMIQNQTQELTRLKRQLAHELSDVLSDQTRPPTTPKKAHAPPQKNISSTLLAAMKPNQEYTVAELRQLLTENQLASKNLPILLAYMTRKGFLQRPRRGVYLKPHTP